MQLSLSKLEDLQSRYVGMKKRVESIKADAHEKIMVVVQSAEIGTSAFAFGLINGRWASPELVGVPVDALTALGMHTAGFLLDNEGAKHLHNLADGAMASYLVKLGSGVGAKMRLESMNPSGAQFANPAQ